MGAVKFVPAENNLGLTGIFEGADYGIIRMSCGAQPDETKKNASQAQGNFAPGFGLKFLRDGVKSANLVTLTPAQDNWNFFSNDFSNHVPIVPAPVSTKFGTVTKFV